MTTEQPSDEQIADAVAARRTRDTHHPIGCLCVPCNTVSGQTSGLCVYCEHPLDNHNFVGRGFPACPGGKVA